jgi:hypothetical protein
VAGKTKPCELGPSGPVSEIEVLAALAQAELHATSWKPYLSDVAHHLGWRFSGQASRRLRPHLERLTSAGLVTTEGPPPHKPHAQRWATTPAGRRRLTSAGPIYLPESPQHRRWRQDRDVAAWALAAVREDAWVVVEEVYELHSGRKEKLPTLSDDFVYGLVRRFEKAFGATGLALRMCKQWPEPSDLAADDAPDSVARLLPEIARKRRR